MILFYGQSLLGIGHWQRLLAMLEACRDLGLPTALVHGAPLPVELAVSPDLPLYPLPFCFSADGDARDLRDAGGAPLTEAWWQTRAAALQRVVEQVSPSVLVTELFPFGRWAFRREVRPLLQHLKDTNAATKVVCSVRDILQPSVRTPERAAAIVALLNTHYHAVLLHTDPDIFPFEHTFPALPQLTIPYHYTGYVLREPAPDTHAPRPPITRLPLVIASAGGGRFGVPLLDTSLSLWEKGLFPDYALWLVAGTHYPAEDFERLQQRCAPLPSVTVFAHLPHLANHFASAALSISQGGYNTLMELLTRQTPAVVIPYTGGDQQEQTIRTHQLAAQGLVTVLEEAALNEETLAAALRATLLRPFPSVDVHAGGATVSAALLGKLHRLYASTLPLEQEK
jgi:predicted glycosyltransferase